MKKKLVGILSACLAFLLGGMLAACAPDAPETKEGEVYRTSVVEVNAMVKAYVSFKDISEANEWGQSGKVYEIIVSSYGGDYGMWSDGYWELDGDTLTLTAVNADDKTCFIDAQKDVAKTYTAVDGVFSLPAKVGGGECTFTLDPEADAVGENEQSPCVKHVDADNDGKCDVCGEDMPTEQPSEGKVQVLLTAKASIEPYPGYTVNAEAKLELYTDATWALFIKTDANPAQPDFVEAASGTYTNTQTEMTLIVTEETMEESLPDTITVAVNAATYPTIGYSADFTYTSAGFDFEFELMGSMEM